MQKFIRNDSCMFESPDRHHSLGTTTILQCVRMFFCFFFIPALRFMQLYNSRIVYVYGMSLRDFGSRKWVAGAVLLILFIRYFKIKFDSRF